MHLHYIDYIVIILDTFLFSHQNNPGIFSNICIPVYQILELRPKENKGQN